MAAKEIIVVRTWKSDSTSNHMPMHVACENIHRNNPAAGTRMDIAKLLFAGQQLETPLAVFSLKEEDKCSSTPKYDKDTVGILAPDTAYEYSVQQMARAWDRLGHPLENDDAPLSVDPDDFPLFNRC